MPLAIGNKTFDLNTPGAGTRTFAHNQNAGADGYLYIIIACPATTVTGVTYNGVAMANVANITPAVYGTQWTSWQLASPSTGSNNVVVTFAAGQYNPVSTYVVSTTGSIGVSNVNASMNTGGPPTNGSLTVSANSIIMGVLLAGNGVGHTITIDGSSRPLDFTHSINNSTSGALSLVLTAGLKDLSVNGSTQVAGFFMEIKEAAAPPVSTQGLLQIF